MKRTVLHILSYLMVAGFGAFCAYFVVSPFLTPAESQTPTPNPAVQEPIVDPLDLPIDEVAETPETNAPDQSQEAALPSSLDETVDIGAMDALLDDGYFYDSKGKRNPFKPFIGAGLIDGKTEAADLTPLQRFDLSELSLVGIMWDIEDPKAMMVSPDEKVHIIGKNDKVGRNNGYVALIREDEVVVIESFEEGGEVQYNTRVISITK